MITLYRPVRFTHPDYNYSGTNYTEYLLGAVGLKVNAEIYVQLAWGTLVTNMRYTVTTNTIERLDGVSTFLDDGWRVGDTFVITGTASNNTTGTITAINADGTIMTTNAVLATETVVSTIQGDRAATSLDFYPNLVENAIDLGLFNLTDRETVPHYFADTISADSGNPTIMTVGTNSHGWVTPADRATVYLSNLSTSTNQIFVINHSFTITPIFLANQMANLESLNPPAAGAFKDRFALKYVYTVNTKFSALDPEVVHTTDGNVTFPQGQTGWFNEFVNGRPSKWIKESILYTDNATGNGLTAVDYCKTVDVDMILQGQDGVVESKYIVHFLYLPLNEDRYINTRTDYKTNFVYERAVVALGSTAQGDNVGDYHFLKNVSFTNLSATRVKFDFQLDFSSVVSDLFDSFGEDNLNYLIFVTASSNLTILGINMASVIMDTNILQCDKDDATLFQVIDEWQFFEYPHCNGTGFSNFSLLPMDTVVAKGQFYVKQGTAIDPIILNNISVSVVAVKQNDVEEFPLESFNIGTAGYLPNCDNVQEIDFAQERDFLQPTGDCRNEIRLFRMPTLDIAGYSAYELIYPFKVRWEEWRALEGANRCFPTPTQNWQVYANQAGWSIKFAINAGVQRNLVGLGTVDTSKRYITEFEHVVWGTIQDPCDKPYAVEFNTLDITGVTSYEELIGKDVDTKIEATITGDFSGFTADQLYGILSLDAWGVGGVAYVHEIGTRIPVDADGVWYGTGSTLVATLTKVSNNTITLSAFINKDYLPTDTNQFILSAKVKEYHQSSSSSGADCLNEILFIAFTCGELQIIEVIDANSFVVSGEVVTDEERSILLEGVTFTFVTSTTWTASGGTIDGNPVNSGTIGGTIIKAPAHPYTDASVGDTIQGDVTGSLNSSVTSIDGIGDMQIGCTFFVS